MQEERFTLALYSNLAATYLKLQQGEKAVKYAKLGVAAAGDSPPAKLLLRLGRAYYMKGDLFKYVRTKCGLFPTQEHV